MWEFLIALGLLTLFLLMTTFGTTYILIAVLLLTWIALMIFIYGLVVADYVEYTIGQLGSNEVFRHYKDCSFFQLMATKSCFFALALIYSFVLLISFGLCMNRDEVIFWKRGVCFRVPAELCARRSS